MTYTIAAHQLTEFLADLSPFNHLSSTALNTLLKQTQPLRYRMGQLIVTREKMPVQVAILYEGQARSSVVNCASKPNAMPKRNPF